MTSPLDAFQVGIPFTGTCASYVTDLRDKYEITFYFSPTNASSRLSIGQFEIWPDTGKSSFSKLDPFPFPQMSTSQGRVIGQNGFFDLEINPLTAEATGKYWCSINVVTTSDYYPKREYFSDAMQMNSKSGAWTTLPQQIAAILTISLTVFKHF